jgi:hypothetical protein
VAAISLTLTLPLSLSLWRFVCLPDTIVAAISLTLTLPYRCLSFASSACPTLSWRYFCYFFDADSASIAVSPSCPRCGSTSPFLYPHHCPFCLSNPTLPLAHFHIAPTLPSTFSAFFQSAFSVSFTRPYRAPFFTQRQIYRGKVTTALQPEDGCRGRAGGRQWLLCSS